MTKHKADHAGERTSSRRRRYATVAITTGALLAIGAIVTPFAASAATTAYRKFVGHDTSPYRPVSKSQITSPASIAPTSRPEQLAKNIVFTHKATGLMAQLGDSRMTALPGETFAPDTNRSVVAVTAGKPRSNNVWTVTSVSSDTVTIRSTVAPALCITAAPAAKVSPQASTTYPAKNNPTDLVKGQTTTAKKYVVTLPRPVSATKCSATSQSQQWKYEGSPASVKFISVATKQVLTVTRNSKTATNYLVTASNYVADTAWVLTDTAATKPSPTPSPTAPTTSGPTATPTPQPTPSTTVPTPSASPSVPGLSATESAVLVLINQERTKRGLKPVQVDVRMMKAARAHSAHMAAVNNMKHSGIGDGDPASRLRAAGYTGSYGENIARGYATPVAVMTGWMNSPGHKANILNPSFTCVGIGAYSASSIWWTQDFGVGVCKSA